MVGSDVSKPVLVAHRGYAKNYPENSLRAFSEAINCGGKYIELDVQLTRDKIPCVIHDDNLLRTGGVDISVTGSDWAELTGKAIGENARLGGRFPGERLTSLADFVTFLHKNEGIHAFVELKEESIQLFGNEVVISSVLNKLLPVQHQCSVISFDHSVLSEVRKVSDLPIGFVVHAYDDEHHELASRLAPDLIICNYKKIPDEDDALWPGDWEWMIYEVTDPEVAFKWFSRGVKYSETMDFSSMITAIKSES